MNSEMFDENMMELLMLALLFVVVRDHRVAGMVNSAVLGVMPDLQLEDENGDATLLQNGLHAVLFAALWWVLGELKVRA